MKRILVWVILFAMPVRSSPARHTTRSAPSGQLAENAQVRSALAWFAANVNWINEQQARLTEIPAPPFQEGQRAAAVKTLLSAAGLNVQTDAVGNVIGELRGANEKEVVVLSAHLDTVFPAGTEVKVRHDGSRMLAPGISDNGTGLAALVAIARAIHEAQIKPQRTILFVADVGEEGEGNLRGMRKLVETYRQEIRYVIALDGSSTDYITTSALASRRVEITVTGPGGHSWSDFGAPNPIHALARGVARFVRLPIP
ncbi:MAG TPA: M20/M25/M40 family metallo-hydrolase, partial [Candidatus Acidoferrum sp.]